MRFIVIMLVVGAVVVSGVLLFRSCERRQAAAQVAAAADAVAAAEAAKPKPPPPPPDPTLDNFKLEYVDLKVPAKLATLTRDCESGILIDVTDQKVLWRKNENTPVEIASMTKMMTALLLMETVKAGKASLETVVPVSVSASKIGGSQVYLDPKESFTLDQLLMCMMIPSANDAAQLVAEYLGGGSAELFIQVMNQRAQALGLRQMKFYNPHGLPPGKGLAENQASALDLAYLGYRLLAYPEVVKWSSCFTAPFRAGTPKKWDLVNHNKLVRTCPGVNGMKTGFTQKSRFCVTVTCERGKHLLVAVVCGSPSSKARNVLAAALLNWGYAQVPGAGLAAGAPVALAVPRAPILGIPGRPAPAAAPVKRP